MGQDQERPERGLQAITGTQLLRSGWGVQLIGKDRAVPRATNIQAQASSVLDAAGSPQG